MKILQKFALKIKIFKYMVNGENILNTCIFTEKKNAVTFFEKNDYIRQKSEFISKIDHYKPRNYKSYIY